MLLNFSYIILAKKLPFFKVSDQFSPIKQQNTFIHHEREYCPVLKQFSLSLAVAHRSNPRLSYLTVFFDTDRWHKGVAERAAEGARNHGLLNISAED